MRLKSRKGNKDKLQYISRLLEEGVKDTDLNRCKWTKFQEKDFQME